MSDKDIGDIQAPKVGSQVGAVLFACNINAVRSAMAEAMPFQAKFLSTHAALHRGYKMGLQRRLCMKLVLI